MEKVAEESAQAQASKPASERRLFVLIVTCARGLGARSRNFTDNYHFYCVHPSRGEYMSVQFVLRMMYHRDYTERAYIAFNFFETIFYLSREGGKVYIGAASKLAVIGRLFCMVQRRKCGVSISLLKTSFGIDSFVFAFVKIFSTMTEL